MFSLFFWEKIQQTNIRMTNFFLRQKKRTMKNYPSVDIICNTCIVVCFFIMSFASSIFCSFCLSTFSYNLIWMKTIISIMFFNNIFFVFFLFLCRIDFININILPKTSQICQPHQRQFVFFFKIDLKLR